MKLISNKYFRSRLSILVWVFAVSELFMALPMFIFYIYYKNINGQLDFTLGFYALCVCFMVGVIFSLIFSAFLIPLRGALTRQRRR